MKKQYINLPPEQLILHIMLIVGTYKDPEKAKLKLKQKMGLNDAQIDLLFHDNGEEELDNAEALKEELLKREAIPYRYDKLQHDLEFLKGHTFSNIGVMIVAFLFLILTIYLGWFDTMDRAEGNIIGLRYFAPPLLLLAFSYPILLELPYSILYFRLKKELLSSSTQSMTLKHIIKIKPLREAKSQSIGLTRGVVLYHQEEHRIVKYYLLAQDVLFEIDPKDQRYQTMTIPIEYYSQSHYITNSNYKEIIRKIAKQ